MGAAGPAPQERPLRLAGKVIAAAPSIATEEAMLAAFIATSIGFRRHTRARPEPRRTVCDVPAAGLLRSHRRSGVVAFRDLAHRKFGGHDLGVTVIASPGSDSEHKEGRAWDYGPNWYDTAGRAHAARTIAFLAETVADEPALRAKRLGVMYIIWNEGIWSAYRAPDRWRPYTGASSQRDRIPISFSRNGW
jgi:hypothetical protein